MNRIIFHIIFLTLLIIQPVSKAIAGIEERNIFLADVLSLAEKPKAYFIIDLGTNKITLMARGISIREWTINKLQFSGKPPSVKIFTLEKKSIKLDDLRPVSTTDDILNAANTTATPNNSTQNNKTDDKKAPVEKKSAYEIIALEIDDMPPSYSLFFNEDMIFNVISHTQESTAFIKKIINSFKQYACDPVLELWNSHHQKTNTEINISFDDKAEAQALFWAFADGMECIILPPGAKNAEDYKL